MTGSAKQSMAPREGKMDCFVALLLAMTRMGREPRIDEVSCHAVPSVCSLRNQEAIMNEDVFNTSLRKFLKKVGITSQREIEKAVRDALESGRLKGNEKLPAKMVLTVGGINLTHEIPDEIELG
jgi:hypothetical protein